MRSRAAAVSWPATDGAVVLLIAAAVVGIADDAIDGLGMRTMRERATHVGATLTVAARAPRGTVVTMTVPSV